MRHIRSSLVLTVWALLCLGVVMIYSVTAVFAKQQFNDRFYFVTRHLICIGLGLSAALGVMLGDYRRMRRWIKPLLLATILLMVVVLIPGIGKEVGGARRWIKFGVIQFQPIEAVKVAFVLYVADFIARKKEWIDDFVKGVLPVASVWAGLAVLLLKQPDLGSGVLLGAVALIMLFCAGMSWRPLVWGMLAAVPAFYVLIMRVPYRLTRIVAFMDPWADPQGSGFQLVQSHIALGSGGWMGREGFLSLGKSLQKLYYLPAAHTDFIFSIIGEEMGFIGCSVVILLFLSFVYNGLRLIRRIHEPFGHFTAIGLVSMIALQALINIGVSLGALPTKGLPLPFVSYGGSALVFQLLAVGLLLNISKIEEHEGPDV